MTTTSVAVRDAAPFDRTAVERIIGHTLLPADRADDEGLRRVLWDDPRGGGLALVAESDRQIIAAAFGSIVAEPDSTRTGFVKLLAVTPEHQRHGTGRRLLNSLERRCQDAGAATMWAGGSQPRFWWPGIDNAAYPDASSLFTTAGYRLQDETVNMAVDLTEQQVSAPTAAPDGVTVRRLTVGEWPAFQLWMARSWEPGWAEEVAFALRRDPISCFTATRDGEYLGFAAYDTNRRGWFGPMGSTPAARGRGVGSAVLRACLADYTDLGRRSCEIAWAGPQDFYHRTVAATTIRHFTRLAKDLQP